MLCLTSDRRDEISSEQHAPTLRHRAARVQKLRSISNGVTDNGIEAPTIAGANIAPPQSNVLLAGK
jgi:hypothetical protein